MYFILYLQYLFQPVDPHQFSSYNNHGMFNLYLYSTNNYLQYLNEFIFNFFSSGICVKVIEYVLETEKRRLTDQISENNHGANFSDSIDKYAPVNYGK